MNFNENDLKKYLLEKFKDSSSITHLIGSKDYIIIYTDETNMRYQLKKTDIILYLRKRKLIKLI